MTQEPIDSIIAADRWVFDQRVTDVFENMLARSIPDYTTMRALVTDVAASYAMCDPEPVVIDLGCSRGSAIEMLLEPLGSTATFHGIDTSPPMLAAARERFSKHDNVTIENLDLRHGYPQLTATVTLVVLTLQFVPIEHRQRVVRDIFTHTRPGGVVILVEKVLGSTSGIDRMMADTYYKLKANNGYSTEQIDRKRASLEGVLVPLTAAWNEGMLREAGFGSIDCFWRWMNFAGWVAVRHDS